MRGGPDEGRGLSGGETRVPPGLRAGRLTTSATGDEFFLRNCFTDVFSKRAGGPNISFRISPGPYESRPE